jgi:SPP1 family predicted phage head-tail adaptor
MTVGRMRHRVQLQSKTTTSDGGGSDAVTTWKTFAEVSASIEGKGGSERLFGDQLQEPITHTIKIRFRRDLTFKNRIQYKSINQGVSSTRVFNIKRIINTGSRDKFLEIMCVEGVAT